MENKFKVSLLAVSVLMGAGFTTTAFADTAADIKALTDPITKTDSGSGAAKTYHDAVEKVTAAKLNEAQTKFDEAKKAETKPTDPISAYQSADEAKKQADVNLEKLQTRLAATHSVAAAELKTVYGYVVPTPEEWVNFHNNIYGYVDLTKTGASEDPLAILTASELAKLENVAIKNSLFGKYIDSINNDTKGVAHFSTAFKEILKTDIATGKVTNPKNLDGTAYAGGVKVSELDQAIKYYGNLYKSGVKAQLFGNVLAANKAAWESQRDALLTKITAVYGDAAATDNVKIALAAYNAKDGQTEANLNTLVTAVDTKNTGLSGGNTNKDYIDLGSDTAGSLKGYKGAKSNYDNAKTIYTNEQSKAVAIAKGTDVSTGAKAYDANTNLYTTGTSGDSVTAEDVAKARKGLEKAFDDYYQAAKNQLGSNTVAIAALDKAKQDVLDAKQARDLAKQAYESKIQEAQKAIDAMTQINGLVTTALSTQSDASTKLTSVTTAYNNLQVVKDLNKAQETVDSVGLAAQLSTYITEVDKVIKRGGTLDTTVLAAPIAKYVADKPDAATIAADRKELIDTAGLVVAAKVQTVTTLLKGDLAGDFTNSKTVQTKVAVADADAIAAGKTYASAAKAFTDAFNKGTLPTGYTAGNDPQFSSFADALAYANAKADLLTAAAYYSSGNFTSADITDLISTDAAITDVTDKKKYSVKIFTDLATLTGSKVPTALAAQKAAQQAFDDVNDIVKKYRTNVAGSMQQLSYLVRAGATGADSKTYTDAFSALATNDGMGAFGAKLDTLKISRNDVKDDKGVVTQKGDKDHVLYLGGLTPDEIQNAIVKDVKGVNDYRAIVLDNTTGQPKTTFSKAELDSLNLGTAAAPVYNTVLNLEAPQLSADFTKPNTLSIGDSGSNAKATNIYATTYQGMNPANDAFSVENMGAAVRIGGDLLDGNVGYLDATGKLAMGADGKPASLLATGTTLGADSIELHHLNINNTMTLKALQQKVAAETVAYQAMRADLINTELANAGVDPAKATEAEKVSATSTVDKAINGAPSTVTAIKAAQDSLELLNDHITRVQGHNTTAIGLLVDSSSKTQVLKGADANGLGKTDGSQYDIFTVQDIAKAPAAPNIRLDNVNILVQDDAGVGTAIKITGKANNLLFNSGSVIATYRDKNAVTNIDSSGYAIEFTKDSRNNLVTFKGVNTIIGDIADAQGRENTPNPGSATPNTVVLDNSHWSGNADSNNTEPGANGQITRNFLTLELANGSSWAGGSRHSPDVVMSGGSSWYVLNIFGDDKVIPSSVNTLTIKDNATLDLVPALSSVRDYLKVYTGRGELDPYYAATLTVEQGINTTGKPDDKGNIIKTVTNIRAAAYSPNSLALVSGIGLPENYRYGSLQVENKPIIGGGTLNLIMQSGGAEPIVTPDHKLTTKLPSREDEDLTPHSFIRFLDKGEAGVDGVQLATDVVIPQVTTEEGVYQYSSEITPVNSKGYRNVFFARNGKLSNSAATVAGLAAAPASVAAIEGNALGKHITSLRHSEGSGVWISYYGGSNQNTLSAGPQYDLKTNGVMLGVDTAFADWMAGIAFTSGKASLSVLNSSGSVNNYGAQFWLSRHYSNGVFVDGVAQFGHYANKARVSMIDGTPARGEYATNGYGLSARVGYAWQQASGFYAEPYVQATARAFSGAAYNLDNGMVVNSTDYKSFVGEIGTDLGYTVPTGAGYFKPYLHLAVLDEFANGNSVRANNIDLQNSINGAALRIGVGGEVKLMQNLGGYLSYDYTKGSNTERPWQVNLGVNYTW